ncbi:MAG: PaaI family thioesterase [Anaerolineae bacterium]|nr:PaaI family thioesterase [Anaerolineae bacterium]
MTINSHTIGQQVMDDLRALFPDSAELKIPPPVFTDMQGEITAYEPGESLTVRFPVLERYQNPLGYMQGGVVVAAADNALGPLAYLVAPPSVTTHMMVEYVRPIKKRYTHIFVEARLTQKTVKQLFLTATIASEHGQILARCHATQSIIGR